MAKAHVVHAMCDVWDVINGRSADAGAVAGIGASRWRGQAVELDPRDAEAHAILGMVALFMRRFDESERRLDTALGLNPNLALAFMLGGGFYALSGESEKAHAHLKEALRLSPRDPVNYWIYAFFGLAEWSAGRYDDAADWARKAHPRLSRVPDRAPPARREPACAGPDGRGARGAGAAAAASRRARRSPSTRAGVPWKKPEDMERYLDALRRAGMPE